MRSWGDGGNVNVGADILGERVRPAVPGEALCCGPGLALSPGEGSGAAGCQASKAWTAPEERQGWGSQGC